MCASEIGSRVGSGIGAMTMKMVGEQDRQDCLALLRNCMDWIVQYVQINITNERYTPFVTTSLP